MLKLQKVISDTDSYKIFRNFAQAKIFFFTHFHVVSVLVYSLLTIGYALMSTENTHTSSLPPSMSTHNAPISCFSPVMLTENATMSFPPVMPTENAPISCFPPVMSTENATTHLSPQ